MSTDEHQNTTQFGWPLAHVRQLASEIGALAFGIEHALDPLSPGRLRASENLTLSIDELMRVVEGVLELHDAADAMAVIVNSFPPREDPLALNPREIAAHAAQALSDGSGDPRFVTLAASMLDSTTGLDALATAITSDPGVLEQWGPLTVGDLLTQFSDADAALVQRISKLARVASDTRWAELDPETTARLAATLQSPNA